MAVLVAVALIVPVPVDLEVLVAVADFDVFELEAVAVAGTAPIAPYAEQSAVGAVGQSLYKTVSMKLVS